MIASKPQIDAVIREAPRQRARRRSRRHRQRRDAQRVSARSALAADAGAHLALLQKRDRARAAHPGGRVPLQDQRAGAVHRHAGAAEDGQGRATGSPKSWSERGHPSFVTAAQETDWNYKRASYGRLSTRHLGVEAGLGTLGLEVNILTPEFGPRIYLTGILTELELEADKPITEQVCIGESCSRCLHSCPADAVLHFGIDKRACATEAQEFGFTTILQFFERFIDMPHAQKIAAASLARRVRLLAGAAARRRLVRRLPALPRGVPGRQRLSRASRRRAEGDPRDARPRRSRSARPTRRTAQKGETIAGLNEWNSRWVGPEGYKGMVARQLQEFKKAQAERERKAEPALADEGS